MVSWCVYNCQRVRFSRQAHRTIVAEAVDSLDDLVVLVGALGKHNNVLKATSDLLDPFRDRQGQATDAGRGTAVAHITLSKLAKPSKAPGKNVERPVKFFLPPLFVKASLGSISKTVWTLNRMLKSWDFTAVTSRSLDVVVRTVAHISSEAFFTSLLKLDRPHRFSTSLNFNARSCPLLCQTKEV